MTNTAIEKFMFVTKNYFDLTGKYSNELDSQDINRLLKISRNNFTQVKIKDNPVQQNHQLS